MRFLRRALAVLLVFSLAATPVIARVAIATKAPPTSAMVNMASMPDCHGMKTTAASHKTSSQKHCPSCDKNKSCSADLCAFKCFKILSALPSPPQIRATLANRFGWVQHAAPVPVDLTPQPPPPRA